MLLDSDLLLYVLRDSAVFALEIISLIFISFRRHKGFERKFMLVYGLVTFSAYNIYIQVVHDFNIPIARTFLFKYNIVGPLYLFDLFVIVVFVFILFGFVFRFSSIKRSLWSEAAALIYMRDFIIFFLSCVAFYVYLQNGMPVDISSQLRPIRGLVLGIVALWMYSRLLKGVVDFAHARKIINTFVLIDLINIGGELISAPIFGRYLWQRGGHDVMLLDQANWTLAICYLPLIFMWRRFGYGPALFGFAFVSLLLYDFTKGLFFFIPITLIVYVAINLLHGKLTKWNLFALCITILAAILVLPGIVQDKAIKGTRGIQLDSYLQFIDHLPSASVLGTGFGGMYRLLEATDDKGEMKEGERDLASDYQVQFQVPVFYYYKIAGYLGFVLMLAALFVLFYLAFINRTQDAMLSYYMVVIAVSSFISSPFLDPEPESVISFCRMLFMGMLLAKLMSEERFSGRLHNPDIVR